MLNYNAVLHIDSDDEAIFRMVMRNARNYLNALAPQEPDLRIVANAKAAGLFTGRHAELEDLARQAVDRGVKIGVCANALAEQKIDHAEVWQFCRILPAGLVEIVRLQRAGFAYIKP